MCCLSSVGEKAELCLPRFIRSIPLLSDTVRLQPSVLAYNLANFLRSPALPRVVKHWSLTTLREKLIKIGAKVVTHARYVTFQMAEVVISRQLFKTILRRISRLHTKDFTYLNLNAILT